MTRPVFLGADPLLTDTLEDLFDERCGREIVQNAEAAGWAPTVWSALTEAGLTSISVPEQLGGSGGTVADALALLWVAGRYAVPLPLAEGDLLAGWLLAAAGIPLPEPTRPVSVPIPDPRDRVVVSGGRGCWHLSAHLHRVPWATAAAAVIAIADAPAEGRRYVVVIPAQTAEMTPGHNLAGEPRDDLTFEGELGDGAVAAAPPDVDLAGLRLRGALCRSVLMAGAMERVAEMTIRYAHERHQFGRPIARFQAVQHHLARLAEEAAAAAMAAEVAAVASATSPSAFEISVAKATTSAAAETVAALAHQVHGAIGMTQEFELQHFTRRLWTWQADFGSARYWHRRLGTTALGAGADALWPSITQGLQAGVAAQ